MSIVDLTGLENLTHLDGLKLHANRNLVSLRGLRNVKEITSFISIVDNVSLPSCEADWLLASLGPGNDSRRVNVSGNTGIGDCSP